MNDIAKFLIVCIICFAMVAEVFSNGKRRR